MSNKNKDLELVPAGLSMSPSDVMRGALEGKITPQNVDVFERLLAIDSQRTFDSDFAKLQSELPTITAKSIIPNRGKYQKFEDIMAEIQPLLSKYGFSVAFENDFKENRIGETCILSHGGHSRKTTYWTRAGRKADNETQADSMASTTARRNALCRALNLVIRQDVLQDEQGDPRNDGSVITPAQVSELEHRAKMLNAEALILKMAGANKFSEILTGAYPVLINAIEMKERKGR